MFTTLAGAGGPGAVDGPAENARFNNPQGIAVDATGNVFVADSFNSTVRKITVDGQVSTVAGLATAFGTENGVGSAARFRLPTSLVADESGHLYVADHDNHVIRKITPDGVVTTFAGAAGQIGTENGAAAEARFSFPAALARDAAGNLYVADQLNHAIRRIAPDGEVSTVAGSPGENGSADGMGMQARFNFPSGIAVTHQGTVYVADSENYTIRRIAPDGTVSTLAGAAGERGSADGTGSSARFFTPLGLAVDPSGNVYVADTLNSTIRKVTPDGVVTTVAGDPTPPDLSARPFVRFADGPGAEARFRYPYGVAVDGTGRIYVADSGNDAIRLITATGVVSTLAGSRPPEATDGPGAVARFTHPTGAALDQAGNLFVVDGVNNTIRKITPEGAVSTVAGSPGLAGSADGVGSEARFNGPRKLAIDSQGNLYVADTANSTIRKVTRTVEAGTEAWQVTTIAGAAGQPGSAEGIGSEARFKALYDIAIDSADNLYVADKDNQVIRKVTPDGLVMTFAGTDGVPGSADGFGQSAQFRSPYGIAVDTADFVYVADTLNHTIRRISPEGEVTTLAGTAGLAGSVDGQGSEARFNAPYGVALDAAKNVYVVDYLNNLVRQIDPQGVVTTIGGAIQIGLDGFPLFGSADGAAANARFYNPKGIAAAPDGTIYIADSDNNAIRKGTPNFCPDLATIDQATGEVGQQRQLDTDPQTAAAWEWTLIRRPAHSKAELSALNVRNPHFTPDVPDLFVFQLRATDSAGLSCIRTLSLTAAASGLRIVSSSASLGGGGFTFTIQGEPGMEVEIQFSEDLVTWSPLETVVNETGITSFIDATAPSPARFYRLHQL